MQQDIKVAHMASPSSGREVPNQFIIRTKEGIYFQSYRSTIAFIPDKGKIALGSQWNASRTTTKYRNNFLGETTEETRKKLEQGEYVLNEDW